MRQVVIYGRGGQGAKLTGDLLLEAFFRAGHPVQGSPLYSGAMMGQLVTYTIRIGRLGDRSLPRRNVDALIIFHQNLLQPAMVKMLAPDGLLLLNAGRQGAPSRGLAPRLACLDAQGIALKHHLVKANVPILSTAMAGAFVRVSGLCALPVLLDAIQERFGPQSETNLLLAREGFEGVTLL
ncbi:MAG: 2-oxoacid:acceptor oxidoreductase family protein [Candidatus Tectomicrobia bacterium]|nr:2-oxoacid:acceptor oxidoreductase family protein [Candidatus Tectomicrobia bacterium]